ncbi:hypothetical protein ACNJL0_19525, partial [Mycobacterium tuberculosis]
RISATIRTARSRSSGGYLLDEPPDMTPSFPRTGVSGHAGAVHVFSFAVDTRPIATLLDYASHPIDPRSYSSVAVTAVGAEATLLAFFFATVGVVASTALNTLRSSPPLLLSSPRLTTGCDR